MIDKNVVAEKLAKVERYLDEARAFFVDLDIAEGTVYVVRRKLEGKTVPIVPIKNGMVECPKYGLVPLEKCKICSRIGITEDGVVCGWLV